MTHLWITYCRNILENSCVVWHSSLTKQNSDDIERTQKSFAKLALGKEYKDYFSALLKLDLPYLSEWRRFLTINFCEKGIKNKTLNDLFPINNKPHKQKTRKPENFKVRQVKKERTKKSTTIYSLNQLNKKQY